MPDYNDKLWYITYSQIQAYLGLHILFGLSPSARTRHWSSNAFLGKTYMKNIMSEKQFERITQYFYCSDIRSEPAKGTLSFDRLYKIREFITAISNMFQEYQSPTTYSPIDEAMVM